MSVIVCRRWKFSCNGLKLSASDPMLTTVTIVWTYEPREVIHVPVRVVAGDAVAQPEHVCAPRYSEKIFPRNPPARNPGLRCWHSP